MKKNNEKKITTQTNSTDEMLCFIFVWWSRIVYAPDSIRIYYNVYCVFGYCTIADDLKKNSTVFQSNMRPIFFSFIFSSVSGFFLCLAVVFKHFIHSKHHSKNQMCVSLSRQRSLIFKSLVIFTSMFWENSISG